MENRRKITIITPAYNAERDIEACILSVANQTYKDKEHLIIDGLSTDRTLDIVRQYAEKYSHIKLVSEKDNGIYDAMNKGIDLACGDWIYFIGCDDVLYDDKVLENIFNFVEDDFFDVIYGNVKWGNTDQIYDGKFSTLKLMEKNICQQAIFYKKKLFIACGKFDLKYTLLADHVFNMKWFNDDNVRRKYVNIIIAKYGIDGRSSTGDDTVFLQDRESIWKGNFPAEYIDNYHAYISLVQQAEAGKHSITVLENKVGDLSRALNEQKTVLAHRQRQIEHLKMLVADRERAIIDLHNSASWRITAPLRKVHAIITGGEAEPTGMHIEPSPDAQGSQLPVIGDIRDHIRQLSALKLAQFLNVPSARLTFPKSDAPLVSVLLVLYNKAEYTYQCLETILANVGISYEIIIVDNASSDRTPELLSRLSNAAVIENFQNVGFLTACNQAAGLAKGKWLLFLNNDTQLLPNLFSTLVETGEGYPGCGAVGAKLVFPDGKLQEAGSIIWNDGSCLGYGRDDDPYKGEYSYVREVDFCSGACLLVRRDLFEQVGRFDDRYAPAYYEEADLCMAIREMGYPIVYQPTAVVIHYEFGSAERSEWAIELQKVNRQKFVDKWQLQLSRKYEAETNRIIVARDIGPARPRILVIDDRVPDPALGCGYPRSYELLLSLSNMGYQVTFFPYLTPERPEPCTTSLLSRGIEVIYGMDSSDFASFFAERREYYDVVWVSRPHNMERVIETIRELNPGQKVIYDAEAVFAVRDVLKARLDGQPLTSDQERERIDAELALVAKADAVVAVSERERGLIRQVLSEDKPSAVLGHALAVEPTQNPFDGRRDLLFVGGILSSPSPNEDAILYFVNQIFPLIRNKLDIRIWIVGTVYVDAIKQLASESVVVTGRVDDLRPFYEQCRLFVVPTRYAGGIPLKLVEAMAHGVPAVVTPLIAEQLELDEKTVLIGDDPTEFAEQVIRLYQNPSRWNMLRDAGLQFVGQEFSDTTFRSRLDTLLKEVTQRTQ